MYSQATVSEKDLISGCIRNERRAQHALYQLYFNSIITLCMRYTKNQEDANEVLQNSFLKVFQHIGTFDSTKSSLYTWIRTIAVRSAIDFLRRKKVGYKTVELDIEMDQSIDTEAFQNMGSQQILALLQKLPDTTQAVFNLFIMEGYQHREIAEILKINEGTSRWHLSEARKILINLLQAAQRA